MSTMWNPNQYPQQHNHPPPPGGMPPHQHQPGVGFMPPNQHQPTMMGQQRPGPPPPGGMPMTPGTGFAPPPPGGPPGAGFAPPPPGGPGGPPGNGFAPPPPGGPPGVGGGFAPPPPNVPGMMRPGPGAPPPPGGMQQLNQGMRGMNVNGGHQAPAMFTPNSPSGPMGGPPPPGPPGAPAPGQFHGSAPGGYNSAAHGGPVGMGGMNTMNTGYAESAPDFSIQVPKELFRSASSTIPATASMVTSCKAPIGGLLRPFTSPMNCDVDVIRPGAGGIVRCHRCRTYINPYVAWVENGRKWRCNICSHLNETSSAYYCHLDANNQRKDKDIRPELSKGVVEWAAPSEYQVRAPQPPTYFFVLDVSVEAVQSGMLQAAANSIKRSLDDLPGNDRTMIGFITYDIAVHYYALAPGSPNAQMMVVGDLEELFVAAPTDLLVYLKDSRAAVDNLLDNLPTMFGNTTAAASCLGPALKAAFTVMKSVGGKMCVFQSVMPNLGEGALKPRENVRMMGTPDEVKLLRPSVSFYKDTALEFSKNHISVDMFVFPSQYIDVASMSELPKLTAGSMNAYVAFDLQKDGPKFESQLYRRLTQPTAFEAVLRIRCTKGMRITNFYGNFNIRGQDLLALPNCTPDSVFAYDLAHDEQSINVPFITVQSALLFTTSDGERRIRVATQALKVTNRVSEFMASVDAEAVAVLLSKQAMNVALKTNLDNARNKLQHTCVEMIRTSKEGDKRTVSGYTVPSNQTEPAGEEKKMPENLELLPLYTLALMKNVAFRGGTDVNPDERITAQMLMSSMFIDETLSFIHPRLYSIHNMDSQAGLPANDDDADNENKTAGRNMILLPKPINLSVERLTSEGVYLLDNGTDSFIWVGRASDAATNNALFGLDSLDGVDIYKVGLNSSGNDLASRLDSIIQAFREDGENNSPRLSARVTVIREGDTGMEARFFWNFIEDRAQFNGGTYNYDEFVQHVNSTRTAHPAPPGAMGRGPPGMAPPGPPRQNQPMAPPGRGGFGAPPPPGPPHPSSGPPPPSNVYGGPPPPSSGPPPPSSSIPSGPPPPSSGPLPSSSGGFGGPPPPSSGSHGVPPPPSSSGYRGPPTSGSHGAPPPPTSGGYGGPPPPSSGGYGGPPPPSSGSYGGPPPPSSGGYGGPPPPSSGGYGGPPPPSSGGYGGPPRGMQPPPSSGGYGGPPPPGSGPPPMPSGYNGAMPPPPR